MLGRGELSKPLTVKAHAVSPGARQKIEAAGGTVELLPLRVSAAQGAGARAAGVQQEARADGEES